jgi:hypothetical protein
MDYIQKSKRINRRDLHIRDNFVPMSAKQFTSSSFSSNKPQGGGIYPVATKSGVIMNHSYNKINGMTSFVRNEMASPDRITSLTEMKTKYKNVSN